jgi:hypothetical protein
VSDVDRAVAFLEQAKSDEQASGSTGLPEATARYLLQQACEKAIKAFGYCIYTERRGDKRHVDGIFFNRHDPVTALNEVAIADLPNGVRILRRALVEFLDAFSERATLDHIDATTPSLNPNAISYRYPFLLDGEWVAPSNFDRWNLTLPAIGQLRTAARKLVAEVGDRISIARRR